MGMSTDAILVYGYDIGSPEEGWRFREAGEWGDLDVDWYDPDAEPDDDEEDSLIDVMICRLYDSIPDAEPADYSLARADVVKARLGVKFVFHCSAEYPMYVLATADFRANRGHVVTVDAAKLVNDPVAGQWDSKLAHVLKVIGLTPQQERPAWLLASDWG